LFVTFCRRRVQPGTSPLADLAAKSAICSLFAGHRTFRQFNNLGKPINIFRCNNSDGAFLPSSLLLETA
jgi:hypothetical protein